MLNALNFDKSPFPCLYLQQVTVTVACCSLLACLKYPMTVAFFSERSDALSLAHTWVGDPYQQELAYRVAGNGPPIVLLHGFVNSSALWGDTIATFQHHYRLYAPDLPAHGQSPPRLPWKLREVAEIVATWLRLLEREPATIIGHSMGGALAMLLAGTRPDLVNRLVLVNPAGLPIQQPVLRAFTRAGLSFSTRQHTHAANGHASLRSQQTLALWQAAEDVLSCDLRPDLSAICCPTTLIWGMRDPLLPLQSAIILQQAITGSELILLPNLRHQPHRQNPHIFHTILRDVLSRGQRGPFIPPPASAAATLH
jgi:pimeloyl-ACP methyl ester carboxylesterase